MDDGHQKQNLDPELISHTIGSDIPAVPANLEHMNHLDHLNPMAGNMMAPVSPPNSSSIEKHTPNMSIGETSTYPTQATPLTSLFSLETGDAWRNQASPQPPMWDYQLDREWETLLTGEDFDLDAVNLSLLYATSDYVPVDAIPGMDITRPPPPAEPASINSINSDTAKRHANAVQQQWHTFSELASSGQMTPDVPREASLIDESYRKRLAERLQQRVQHGILPSTPFLVCYVFSFDMSLSLHTPCVILILQPKLTLITMTGSLYSSILFQIPSSFPHRTHAHVSTRNSKLGSSPIFVLCRESVCWLFSGNFSWHQYV